MTMITAPAIRVRQSQVFQESATRLFSKIAKCASIALNEANANGSRTTPRRARGAETYFAAGRRHDQDPRGPYRRARKRRLQRLLRAHLHPRLGEELRRAPQAR